MKGINVKRVRAHACPTWRASDSIVVLGESWSLDLIYIGNRASGIATHICATYDIMQYLVHAFSKVERDLWEAGSVRPVG
jgi:hypothetical protein